MSVDKHCTVGVDVGGTFTDIFMFDQASQAVKIVKTPSTIDDQSRGLVDGVSQSIDDFSAILNIVHGTTTGTNALLERKGARTGIITTRGRSKRKSGNPSSLSRENGKPPVSTSPNQLSTLQQRFACARLPASCLTRSGLDFSATLTRRCLYRLPSLRAWLFHLLA
jgi:N-methylhydantoinase A